MCCLLQYVFRNVADASSPASVNNRHSARFLTEHVPGLGNRINSAVAMEGAEGTHPALSRASEEPGAVPEGHKAENFWRFLLDLFLNISFTYKVSQ